MKVSKPLLIVSIFLIGMLSSAQNNIEEETRLFNLIDTDKNEIITIREMTIYYKKQTDENGEPINAKRLFYGLDANRNSIISLSEYVNGVDWQLADEFIEKWDENAEKKNTADYENILVEKFTKIDADDNEELSYKEVVEFYENKVSKTTGNPIDGKLNFYAYDENEDGKISQTEFLKKPNWELAAKRLEDEKIKVQMEEELNPENQLDAENTEDSSEIDSISYDYLNEQIALFSKADKDENYKLTIEELGALYKGQKDENGDEINLRLKFFGFDQDENGFVDLVEFTSKLDWEAVQKRYELVKQ